MKLLFIKAVTCERLSHDLEMVTGAGCSRDGGRDMVMELGRLG